jgi:hypothetical protein
MLLKYRGDFSLVDILKETKTVVNNSSEYNSYMTKYNTIGSSRNKEKLPLSSISLNLHSLRKTIRYLDFTSPDNKQPWYRNKAGSLKTEESTGVGYLNSSKLRSDNPISIFYTQSEMLVDDPSYYEKEYNINEIYRKDDYYVKLVLNKIDELKAGRGLNDTAILYKNLGGESGKDCMMSLHGLEVKFISGSNTKPIIIMLPFALLPMFYMVDIETFKTLLMVVLKFTDDTYSNIELDSDLIHKALNFDAYNTEYNDTVKFDNNNIHKFNWITNKCIYDVYIR